MIKRSRQWGKFPKSMAIRYYGDLRPIIERLRRKVRQVIEPELAGLGKHSYIPSVSMDDSITEKVGRMFGRLRVNFFGQEYQAGGTAIAFNNLLENQIEKTAKSLSMFHKARFQANVDHVLGVQPLRSEPWLNAYLRDWTMQNVSLIKDIPEIAIDDMQKIIIESVMKGEQTQKLRWAIQDKLGISETRAKLIARDQTNKLYGTLTELRSVYNGWEFYQWDTVEDEAVRPDHKRLNGKIYKFSEPPVTVTSGKRAGERNNPGLDIQCRCLSIIIFDRNMIVNLVRQSDGSYKLPKQIAA